MVGTCRLTYVLLGVQDGLSAPRCGGFTKRQLKRSKKRSAVHKLSHAEQLLLISSITQLLSEDESGQLPDDVIVQSVLFPKPFITK